ncbi:MAG: GDSL-type esterase/lipase family protein [Actinomycetota bacterium]
MERPRRWLADAAARLSLRQRCREHPRLCAAAAAMLVILALPILWWASQTRLLTTAAVLLGIGLGLGLLALLLIGELLVHENERTLAVRQGRLADSRKPTGDRYAMPLPGPLAWVVSLYARHPGRILIGLGLVAAGGASLLTTRFDWLAGPIVALALVPALVAVVGLLVRYGKVPLTAPLLWMVAGVIGLIVGLALSVVTTGSWLVAGVLVMLAGLTALKLSLLPVLHRVNPIEGRLDPPQVLAVRNSRRSARVCVLGALALVAGLGLTWWALESPRPQLIVIGLSVAAIGLTVAGVAGPTARFTRAGRRALLPNPGDADAGAAEATVERTEAEQAAIDRADAVMAGVLAVGAAVMAAAGYLLLTGVVADWTAMALVIAVVLVGIGAWSVFRGEGLIALALLIFILAWALDGRDTQDPVAFNTDNGRAELTGGLLAVGDSFMSGEGAADYFAGTNEPEVNECRRSATSYAALVAVATDLRLHHFACSGATTEDVRFKGQMKGSPDHVAGAKSQIESLAEPTLISSEEVAALEVVLVSIGGNDSGFGSIIQSCLLPSDCSENGDDLIALAQSLQPDLQASYEEIEASTADAVVVVVPYPQFIEVARCGRLASQEEFAFVADFIRVLNETMVEAAIDANATSAARGGSPILVFDNSNTFLGRSQCSPGDRGPAANLVILSPTSGPLPVRLNPAKWVHGSMHPYADGHALQAGPLTEAVQRLLDADCDSGGCRPTCPLESGDPVIAEMVTDGLLVDLCSPPAGIPVTGSAEAGRAFVDDGEWLTERLLDAGRRLLGPVALLMGSGLVGALGLVRLSGRKAGPLSMLGALARFLGPVDSVVPEVNNDDTVHVVPLSPGQTEAVVLGVVARSDADGPPDRVTVHCGPPGGPAASSAVLDEWFYFSGGRHPFWWSKATIEGLTAGSTYRLAPDGGGPEATVRTLPPNGTEQVSMIVGSCYYRNNVLADKLPEVYGELSGDDHVLNFWLGDQVYVDAPWTAGLRVRDLRDLVAKRYLDSWEIGGGELGTDLEDRIGDRSPEERFGRLLRASGNWFLPDDHEFWNGYPGISYATLFTHAVGRRLSHRRRRRAQAESEGVPLLRRASQAAEVESHPVRQGTFGTMAGLAYSIFQTNLEPRPDDGGGHRSRFDDKVVPEPFTVIPIEGQGSSARLILVDTRWHRTLDRLRDGAGFMRDGDLTALEAELAKSGFAVVLLSRPLVNTPSVWSGRGVDAGAEAYPRQYDRLCRALVERAACWPTLVVAGDVHHQRVRSAAEHRLLEIVSSPIVELSGQGTDSRLFKRLAPIITGRAAPSEGLLPGPKREVDRRSGQERMVWEATGGTTYVPPEGGEAELDMSGLVRLDLDLSGPAPAVDYRFLALDERHRIASADWCEARFQWSDEHGWQRPTADDTERASAADGRLSTTSLSQ